MSNIGHNSKEFEELNRKEAKLINDINDKKKMDKLVEASNRIRTTSHYQKLTDFAWGVGDSVKDFITKYSTPLHYGEPDNQVLDVMISSLVSGLKNANWDKEDAKQLIEDKFDEYFEDEEELDEEEDSLI